MSIYLVCDTRRQKIEPVSGKKLAFTNLEANFPSQRILAPFLSFDFKIMEGK